MPHDDVPLLRLAYSAPRARLFPDLEELADLIDRVLAKPYRPGGVDPLFDPSDHEVARLQGYIRTAAALGLDDAEDTAADAPDLDSWDDGPDGPREAPTDAQLQATRAFLVNSLARLRDRLRTRARGI